MINQSNGYVVIHMCETTQFLDTVVSLCKQIMTFKVKTCFACINAVAYVIIYSNYQKLKTNSYSIINATRNTQKQPGTVKHILFDFFFFKSGRLHFLVHKTMFCSKNQMKPSLRIVLPQASYLKHTYQLVCQCMTTLCLL